MGTIDVDDAHDAQTVPGKVGDVVRLSLTENRTTGFHWVISDDGDPVAALLDSGSAAPSTRSGQPGQRSWIFRIKEPGEVWVRFVLKRSWEKDPVRSFSLHLVATA
jgi:predicted secreted protein